MLRAMSEVLPNHVRPRQMHLTDGRRVRVRDLIEAGLLEAGERIEFRRPRHSVVHEAVVTEDGAIELDDGQSFSTPTAAACAAAGIPSAPGWAVWTRQTGETLDTVRQRFLEQASRDGAYSGNQGADDSARHIFLKEARDLADARKPINMSVKELVARWGVSARSATVDTRIEADLANYGLFTVPSFRKVTLDTLVDLVGAGTGEDETAPEDEGFDVGLTVGNLPSALGGVTAVTPQSTFEEAITKMMLHDYSQLAVLSGHTLRGAITWRSVAQARHEGAAGPTIAPAIVPAEPVPYDTELIDVLPRLYEDDFVFVRGERSQIAGIVTAADVVLTYRELSTPFLLVGQIDRLLRRLVGNHFSIDEIAGLCDPDGIRHLRHHDELTIGDYKRVLERDDNWQRLSWKFDRKVFIEHLERVRVLRNDITHFNPDPLPGDATATLRHFFLFLKRYVT